MALHFESYSLPDALKENTVVSSENTDKISKRLKKANNSLVKKMKAIGRKEKRSWQKSHLRNSKRQ